MSHFFAFQPEVLSTINFMPGSMLSGHSATFIFGALFFILALVVLIARHYEKLSVSLPTVIMVTALIAWTPLGVQFFLNEVRVLRQSWLASFSPLNEQIDWRYCHIDKAQRLGGDFCGLRSFVGKLKEYVPAGSSVGMANSTIGPYLMYYLFDSYRVNYSEAGEYLIIFHPIEAYFYDGRELFVLKNGEKLSLGSYAAVFAFGSNQAVFKKINH